MENWIRDHRLKFNKYKCKVVYAWGVGGREQMNKYSMAKTIREDLGVMVEPKLNTCTRTRLRPLTHFT